MNLENIKFDDTEVEEKQFHQNKRFRYFDICLFG